MDFIDLIEPICITYTIAISSTDIESTVKTAGSKKSCHMLEKQVSS